MSTKTCRESVFTNKVIEEAWTVRVYLWYVLDVVNTPRGCCHVIGYVTVRERWVGEGMQKFSPFHSPDRTAKCIFVCFSTLICGFEWLLTRSTPDMTELWNSWFKKKKPALQIPGWPLALFCSSLWCMVAAMLPAKEREREIETDGGRDRSRGWVRGGEEREGTAAVFGFQSSPSGKGCAESGLCPPAQSQPSEGTTVLCVIVNRQCILLSPLLPNRPSPRPTLQLTPPLTFTCSSPVRTEKTKLSQFASEPQTRALHLVVRVVYIISQQPHLFVAHTPLAGWC